MLTTAQPNGRLYCTLHRFFFSPAPILPAHGYGQNNDHGRFKRSRGDAHLS